MTLDFMALVAPFISIPALHWKHVGFVKKHKSLSLQNLVFFVRKYNLSDEWYIKIIRIFSQTVFDIESWLLSSFSFFQSEMS